MAKIDKERIPESTYNEMVELFGIEKAEKIIIDNQYNFRAISNIILGEQFIKYFGLEKLRNKVNEKTHIPAKYLFLILIIICFLIYFFWPYLIN